MIGEREFYTRLFTEDPRWSARHPNCDEALRAGKLLAFLSEIAQAGQGELRILDLGCGRGWLTFLAHQYGACDGVDPVASVVEHAAKQHPDIAFFVGTARTVRSAADFRPYDVVLCSEVIEHVRDAEKRDFVRDLRSLLKPRGHALVTSPRGEWFQAWSRMGSTPQPVEDWLAEKDLRRLLCSQGFIAVRHERVYLPLPRMSLLHRCCESTRLVNMLRTLRLDWLLAGLRHIAGFYQVWWFQAGEAC
jgi:2-polyprenyl-3-methyl-5-hydroxy-6-metoxy-1,4-benzoquinol methylase